MKRRGGARRKRKANETDLCSSPVLDGVDLFRMGMSEDDGGFARMFAPPTNITSVDDQTLQNPQQQQASPQAKKQKRDEQPARDKQGLNYEWITAGEILGLNNEDFYSSCEECLKAKKRKRKRDFFWGSSSSPSSSGSDVASIPDDSQRDSSESAPETTAKKRKGSPAVAEQQSVQQQPSASPKKVADDEALEVSTEGDDKSIYDEGEEEVVLLQDNTEDRASSCGHEKEAKGSSEEEGDVLERDPSDPFTRFIREREDLQAAEDFCVGCYYTSIEQQPNFGIAIKEFVKLIWDNFGSMDNKMLAKTSHKYYMTTIYHECIRLGYPPPPIWTTRSILDHIENHVMDPSVFLYNSLKELKHDILALNKMLFRFETQEDGSQRVVIDEHNIKARNELYKMALIFFRSKPKEMNFHNDKREIDLKRVGGLLNAPSYIRMELPKQPKIDSKFSK